MLRTGAVAVDRVPSPLRFLDEIKGNVVWPEGISAMGSQNGRALPGTQNTESKGSREDPQSRRKEGNAHTRELSEPPGLISRSARLENAQHH